MGNSKNRKRRRLLVFTVLLLGLGSLAAVAILKRREVVIPVQTEKVVRRNLTETIVANGRIHPVVQVKISPEVSGEIIALPVKEGQHVHKGDLLLKIKPDFYEASRNSAEASYLGSLAGQATAAATLQKAELEFQRNQELYERQLISDSAFLEVRTAYEIAKAQLTSAVHQVEMAKAALDRAREDLRKTEIYSPIDGTVSKLNSQLGERVVGTAMMAGTEVMIIADLDQMEARVDVNEIDVVLVQVGQKALLEVDAFRDRTFAGVVTDIANSSRGAGLIGGGGQSQEATKFEVRIRFHDREAFRPGMSVTAEIQTRYRTNVLTVPIAAVTTRLPKETKKNQPPNAARPDAAAAAEDCETNAPAGNASGAPAAAVSATNAPAAGRSPKPGQPPKPIEVVFIRDGDRARMVPVKLGISDDDYYEITAGLSEGQEVISGGYRAVSRDLEDGKRIVVKPVAEPATGKQ
jgi:HlyD family secretion protein